MVKMNTVSGRVWYIGLEFSISFPIKMRNWMRFIKVVIKYVPLPADPSSHSYILRKYVREITPPKGILGLGGGGRGLGGVRMAATPIIRSDK